MAKNYYEILGVSKTASADEIKSAYRKLVVKYHPDHFATASEAEKKAAEDKLKEINHAYDVLSDSQKRAAYDNFGDENGPTPGSGFSGGGFGSAGGFGINIDDIFSSIFSGFGGGRSQSYNAPQRGRDILTRLEISFEEAAFGTQKTVRIKRVETCPDCHGTGAKDSSSIRECPQCHGSGQVTIVQTTPLGQMRTTSVCPNCKGSGKIIADKCATCGGQGMVERLRDVKVNIQAGIDTGQRISYAGEGHSGINGGGKGSLVVEITVRKHKLFTRKGADLHLDLPISFVDAAIGCTVSVPTLEGNVDVKIPEGTQSGAVIKVAGKGIKRIKGISKGDLYVHIVVEIPRSVTREQKEALKKLSDTFDKKQYPLKKAYEEKQ